MKEPRMKVSVLMLAFNHEPFIEQAMLSALGQETDFDFELVVGEDNSTDNTRLIIDRICLSFPNKIRVISSENNVGAQANFRRTLLSCSGEYIAFLEGDDFWTDSFKLRKQVAFLEANPDFALCCTDVDALLPDGTTFSMRPQVSYSRSEFTIEDVITENIACTCSMVVRQSAVSSLPSEFAVLKMGDWPTWVLASQYGKLKFLSDVTAKYRIHANGAWGMVPRIDQYREILAAYIAFREYFKPRFSWTIKQAIHRSTCVYALASIDRREHAGARLLAFKALFFPNLCFSPAYRLRPVLRLCFPWLESKLVRAFGSARRTSRSSLPS